MNKIIIAVIGALGAIIVALLPILCHKETNAKVEESVSKLAVAGIIVDAKTNKGIGQAHIVLVGRNESDYSQDDGNFRIEINGKVPQEVRLNVTKDGYAVSDEKFNVPNENIQIQLRTK